MALIDDYSALVNQILEGQGTTTVKFRLDQVSRYIIFGNALMAACDKTSPTPNEYAGVIAARYVDMTVTPAITRFAVTGVITLPTGTFDNLLSRLGSL